MRLLAVLLLVVSAFAQSSTSVRSTAGGKSAFDKATFESFLRYLTLFPGPVEMKIDDPKPSKTKFGYTEVVVHLSSAAGTKDDLYYLSADGQTIVREDPPPEATFNINKNPFQGNLEKLNIDNQPSFGPASAPVTIVEFGDLQCPSCRAEAPLIRQLIPQFYSDKVRVVFKDYPLESIHPWARAASVAGRCVFHQNPQAFWKFYDWMYDTQEQITPETLRAKTLSWAGSNGVDPAQLGRCMDSKEADAEVAKNIAEGKALDVRGTPTLFINGRKLGGTQWPVLQMVIEMELRYKASYH